MTLLEDILRRNAQAGQAAMERLSAGGLRDPAGRRLEMPAAASAREAAPLDLVPPPDSWAEAVVEFLNQELWSELEDYILDNADTHDLKLSVFTGCVFDPADPPYRGAQIPRAFWKIVAYRQAGPSGSLRASGYLLDQAHLIRDVQESFSFGAFETYQLSIAGIAARTGLQLAALQAADVVGAQESFALTPLARTRDIRF